MSVRCAAAILSVGLDRAYAAAARGDLPAIRVGAEWRVVSAKLLDQLGIGPEPTPPAASAADDSS